METRRLYHTCGMSIFEDVANRGQFYAPPQGERESLMIARCPFCGGSLSPEHVLEGEPDPITLETMIEIEYEEDRACYVVTCQSLPHLGKLEVHMNYEGKWDPSADPEDNPFRPFIAAYAMNQPYITSPLTATVYSVMITAASNLLSEIQNSRGIIDAQKSILLAAQYAGMLFSHTLRRMLSPGEMTSIYNEGL